MTTTINPQNAVLDHERFSQYLENIAEHHGIETQVKLAEVIGVGEAVLQRIRRGEGVMFDSMLKIIAWAKVDVRKYIVDASVSDGAPAAE